MTQWAIYSVPFVWFLSLFPAMLRRAILIRAGSLHNAHPRDHDLQTRHMSLSKRDFLARLQAAHDNQMETLGYYAAAISIAISVNVNSKRLHFLIVAFLVARVLFIVAYAAPQFAAGSFRTLAFVSCMVCIALIYVAAAVEIS